MRNRFYRTLQRWSRLALGLLALATASACTTAIHTQSSGDLKQMSRNQIVAILPVETQDKDQQEYANLFRLSLYANLKQAQFTIMERYLVDALLSQNGLTDPARIRATSPQRLGEILGADAVIFSKVEKMERLYLVVHSSIKLGVSAKMADTRTGETLWEADQDIADFSGLGKIPTGIPATVLAPLRLVGTKTGMNKIATVMAANMAGSVRNPREIKDTNPPVEMASSEVKKDTGKTLVNPPGKPGGKVRITAKKAIAAIPAPGTTAVADIDKESPFYTVQVGVYTAKAASEKMILDLIRKGYSAFSVMLHTENGDRYKVQVEKFRDKDEAAQLAKRLESREKLKSFVTKAYAG